MCSPQERPPGKGPRAQQAENQQVPDDDSPYPHGMLNSRP